MSGIGALKSVLDNRKLIRKRPFLNKAKDPLALKFKENEGVLFNNKATNKQNLQKIEQEGIMRKYAIFFITYIMLFVIL